MTFQGTKRQNNMAPRSKSDSVEIEKNSTLGSPLSSLAKDTATQTTQSFNQFKNNIRIFKKKYKNSHRML